MGRKHTHNTHAQNPVFEIVHDSVKVYPHMYNANVQQNPLCVESCVTKEFSMSPRFSAAFFYPDANSVLLRAQHCTAVDYAQKTMCSKLFKKTWRSIQRECPAEPLKRSILRCKFSTPTSTSLYSGINTLYAQNPVFEVVHDESVKVYPHMYNGNVQQNPLCVKSCVTK